MKRTPVTLGKLAIILALCLTPVLIILVHAAHEIESRQSARGALYRATVVRFSRYELIYTDARGQLRTTKNKAEYERALESFLK